MRSALLAAALLFVALPARATSVGVSYMVPFEGAGGFGAMAQFGFGILPKLSVTAGAGYQELGWAADDPKASDAHRPWIDTGSLRADVGVEYDLWQAEFVTLSVLGGLGILVPLSAGIRPEAVEDLEASFETPTNVDSVRDVEAGPGPIGGAGFGLEIPAGPTVLDLEARYVRAWSTATFRYDTVAGELAQTVTNDANPNLYFAGFELSLTVSF